MMKRDFVVCFPFIVRIFDEKDDNSSDEQRCTYEKRISEQRFYVWVYEKAGDSGGNESDNEAFDGGDSKDFLPIHVEHGEDRPELYSYLEDDKVVRLGDVEEVGCEDEVSSRRDGKKLGEAFDDTQVERLK
jgi:hypothetical protein